MISLLISPLSRFLTHVWWEKRIQVLGIAHSSFSKPGTEVEKRPKIEARLLLLCRDLILCVLEECSVIGLKYYKSLNQ